MLPLLTVFYTLQSTYTKKPQLHFDPLCKSLHLPLSACIYVGELYEGEMTSLAANYYRSMGLPITLECP